jgi:hypothetical protein
VEVIEVPLRNLRDKEEWMDMRSIFIQQAQETGILIAVAE